VASSQMPVRSIRSYRGANRVGCGKVDFFRFGQSLIIQGNGSRMPLTSLDQFIMHWTIISSAW
jgi:hypothetical protein